MDENLIEKLQAPFRAEEIDFRILNTNPEKTKAKVAAYVTNSAIQNRLDEVFSPFGWQSSFKDWKNGKGQICTLSVYDNEKKMWIIKEDGAEDSSISPIKGGLSDSMKRCARMLGIGRYLISAKEYSKCWVEINKAYPNSIPNDVINNLRVKYNQELGLKKAASTPANINSSRSNRPNNSNKNTSNTINSSNTNNGTAPVNTHTEANVHQNLTNNVNSSNNFNSNSNVEQTKTPLPNSLIDVINGLLNRTNTNLASMLNAYGVKNLAELTLEQGNDALKKLATKN